MNRKTIHREVWFSRDGKARKLVNSQIDKAHGKPHPLRLSRLMALVIRYQQLIDEAHIANRADLSQLAEVSTARLTQIMNLLLLAPDIQEEILFLPLTTARQDPLSEREMRSIVAEPCWEKQREMWRNLIGARF